ncbi:MAG: type III polyketide synthase [Rivularia sp. (in: cyanobacteria)]
MTMNIILPVVERLEIGAPPNEVSQSDAAEFVANIPTLKKNRHRIGKLYANTRIEARQMAIDLTKPEAVAFHTQHPNIQTRMAMYKESAVPLAEEVARKALKDTSASCENTVDRELIDSISLVVVVSSTGFLAPGIDAELIKRLGLKRNTARAAVSFMGCAAAMNGLRVACDHVRAYPDNKVLLVCVEMSSVNAVFEDNINDVIIHSLFGDGCGVAVIGACDELEAQKRGHLVIEEHMSYLVEDTEDGITLGINDNGITCKLSRYLPNYLENNVGRCIEGFLAQQGLSKQDIDLWAVHPGGTRIIENVQSSLGLRDDQVADSWEILRKYGNMLSVAVLFVIKRMMDRIEIPKEASVDDCNGNDDVLKKSWRGIAFSFAPGVGVEGITFRKFMPCELPKSQKLVVPNQEFISRSHGEKLEKV